MGTLNPIRYKGYYYDNDLQWYHLQSRFYDPAIGRFISPDDLSLLTESQGSLTDKNLYSYCDNNPIMRKDTDGEFWQLAAPAVTWSYKPFFYAATALSLIYARTTNSTYYSKTIDKSKAKERVNPYARPNQKKQNREVRNKARESDKWVQKSKPKPPKKHTPGKDHRVNKQKKARR